MEPVSRSRPELRPAVGRPQEPPEGDAAPGRLDRTRDELAIRCPELELLDPEALDLGAELYVAIHEPLAGRATLLRGNRRAKYFREQLRGVHPLTVEDLARLLRAVPRDMLPFVRLLARAVGCTLVPLAGRGEAAEIHEAGARAAETHGRAVGAVMRAAADGVIDGGELEDIDAEIEEAERRLQELKSAAARKASADAERLAAVRGVRR